MEVAVRAIWDPEASVRVAESDDVPGLVTEAEDIEALVAKLKILIPELLDANGVAVGEQDDVAFVLTASRHERAARSLMADFGPRVRRLLREAGCRREQQGKGDDESLTKGLPDIKACWSLNGKLVVVQKDLIETDADLVGRQH